MKKIALFIFIVTQINLFGQSCSDGSLIIRGITPSDTDSNIDQNDQQHQVFFNPECEQTDILILHMVGSFDNPSNTTFYPSLAANNGFKIISLEYTNGIAASSACKDSENSECFSQYRQEIIYGDDVSAEVEVDEHNSILNRFEKLLNYLIENYPNEDWGVFQTETGGIKWDKVILSGHSQGGGHAAYMAKQFEVNRVLMFSSPNDYSDFYSEPASWLSMPSATQDSNYYAFSNVLDNVVSYDKQYENWTAMNLLTVSDSSIVDNAVCDFNESKLLYTTYDPTFGIGIHSSVILDSVTPKVDGVPIFIPVWEYMLGICEGTISTVLAEKINMRLFPNPTDSHMILESDFLIEKLDVLNLNGQLLVSFAPMSNRVGLDLEQYRGILILDIDVANSNVNIKKRIVVNR